MIIRGRKGGVASSELRAIEAEREAARAAAVAASTKLARRERRVTPAREPGEGWDSVHLRVEVAREFSEAQHQDGGRR